MSKAFFRFLRGELNGFYITSINQALIEYSADIRRFLLQFHEQQFNLETMSADTLYNLGKFASIFLPRRKVSEVRSSVYMTEDERRRKEEERIENINYVNKEVKKIPANILKNFQIKVSENCCISCV